MFERFTGRARQVVLLAQEEARTLKHDHIGTEHLLLGLFREEAVQDADGEVKLERREYAYLRDLVGREPVADERAHATYEKLKVLAKRAAL